MIVHMNNAPNKELVKEIRAALLLRDSSLTVWAEQHGIKCQNLTKTLSGLWTGPTARTVIEYAVKDIHGDRS